MSTLREKYGPRFFKLGSAGVAVLLLAFCLTGVALANGVHCPECDQGHLSAEQFSFWKSYFVAKDGVYGGAALLLAIASPLASPRRWPFVFALAIALFAFMLTPM
jgi:hypothetical protein